jgi:hypothetical protein
MSYEEDSEKTYERSDSIIKVCGYILVSSLSFIGIFSICFLGYRFFKQKLISERVKILIIITLNPKKNYFRFDGQKMLK